jgi:hypothetical protein
MSGVGDHQSYESELLFESDFGALLFESDFGVLLFESDFVELLLLDDDEPLLDDDELESSLFFAALAVRFDGPEYKSDSQPPPFKMKLPPPIIRRAFILPHLGHFLMGASVMRCSRSNSFPQLSQLYS